MDEQVDALIRTIRHTGTEQPYELLGRALDAVLAREGSIEPRRATEVAEALQQWAGRVSRHEASGALLDAARLLLQHAGDASAAEGVIGRAIDQSPEDQALTEGAVHLFAQAGAHEQLERLLHARCVALDRTQACPRQRVRAWFRLGHLRRKQLDDQAGAIAAFRTAMSIDAGEAAAHPHLSAEHQAAAEALSRPRAPARSVVVRDSSYWRRVLLLVTTSLVMFAAGVWLLRGPLGGAEHSKPAATVHEAGGALLSQEQLAAARLRVERMVTYPAQGKRNDAAFLTALEQRGAAIRSCWSQVPVRALPRSVTLQWSARAQPLRWETRVLRSSVGDAQLERCVLQRLSGTSLPAPSSQTSIVQATFTLADPDTR